MSCGEAVQLAVDNLKTALEESGVRIKLPKQPLPRVIGDETQLVQLFQNLLGNAIKFRDEQPPEIQIDAKLDGGGNTWQFSIKDNGIDMDMQYADEIFTIFERLHTAGEYEGTGVGLALCKKIVAWHDGEIRVDSTLGKGGRHLHNAFQQCSYVCPSEHRTCMTWKTGNIGKRSASGA